MGKYIPYNSEEILILRNNYKTMSRYELSKLINRTPDSIANKLSKLNLHKPLGYKSGKRNAFYGKHHSEKTKRIISNKNSGENLKISETRKRLFREGKIITKNKGKKLEQQFGEEKAKIIRDKMKNNHADISGEKNPMFGKHHSEETLKKIHSPEKTRKRLMACLKKPNKKEKVLIKLIDKNNFPFKFVGDGQVIIANRNPDFISTDNSKKIIELFGEYWHNKEIRKREGTSIKKAEDYFDEMQRIDLFAKYGFETLIIWENELKEIKKVEEKINKFIGDKKGWKF